MIVTDVFCISFRFNFDTNEWTEVAPMAVARSHATRVILSGRLFLIGGIGDRSRFINSVECYDPLADRWQTLAPLLKRRSAPAACVSNGFIYVFGGGRYDLVQSIERFYPDPKSWTEVSKGTFRDSSRTRSLWKIEVYGKYNSFHVFRWNSCFQLRKFGSRVAFVLAIGATCMDMVVLTTVTHPTSVIWFSSEI